MSSCNQCCGGLIMEQNKVYGYSGKVCYCAEPEKLGTISAGCILCAAKDAEIARLNKHIELREAALKAHREHENNLRQQLAQAREGLNRVRVGYLESHEMRQVAADTLASLDDAKPTRFHQCEWCDE